MALLFGGAEPCMQFLKEGIMRNIDMKFYERISDGGNGNHSVSLPIILIKNEVDQMLPSSYINLLLVSIL